MSTFDARGNKHSTTDGKFETQLIDESGAVLDLPALRARVHFQRWSDRGHPVDVGEEDFDAAQVLAFLGEEKRSKVVDAIVSDQSSSNDEGDLLGELAQDLGLVSRHDGPFYVYVDSDDLDDWAQSNPITPEVQRAAQTGLLDRAQRDVVEERDAIRQKELDLARRSNRLELASRILGASDVFASGDTVQVVQWNDWNEDGSFDVSFGAVFSEEGEQVGDFAEMTGVGGALPAAWAEGTDFDSFMVDCDGDQRIAVDKVRAWVNAGAC